MMKSKGRGKQEGLCSPVSVGMAGPGWPGVWGSQQCKSPGRVLL